MSMSIAQMRDRARLLYAGRRDQIERARAATKWRDKRPEEWFVEQKHILEEIAEIGMELAFIAENLASYRAWKFSHKSGVPLNTQSDIVPSPRAFDARK